MRQSDGGLGGGLHMYAAAVPVILDVVSTLAAALDQQQVAHLPVSTLLLLILSSARDIQQLQDLSLILGDALWDEHLVVHAVRSYDLKDAKEMSCENI